MAGFNAMQSFSGGGDQFGEALEKNIQVSKPTQNQTTTPTSDSYSAWNAFLNPDQVQIQRLDTSSTNTNSLETPSYSAPVVLDSVSSEPEKVPTFEEIFARVNGLSVEKPAVKSEDAELNVAEKAEGKRLGEIVFNKTAVVEISLAEKGSETIRTDIITAEASSEPKSVEQKKSSSFIKKEQLLGSAEKIADVTTKIFSFGGKEGKQVFGALKDLWKTQIYIKEKKPDPKAKENAEKAAKRKANKQRFIALLKEGMSLYYAEMRKALLELEAKLGVNVLRTEEKNRLLGRNRNASFEGNDSVYAIHQTAYAMMEQRRRQQEASKPKVSSRGKPSAGQIFTDKTLQGERSGGNNMMSAVG